VSVNLVLELSDREGLCDWGEREGEGGTTPLAVLSCQSGTHHLRSPASCRSRVAIALTVQVPLAHCQVLV